MKTKTCPICGKTYRKGTIVLVATDGDAMVARRVCTRSTCGGRAIQILPLTPTPRCKCGEPATQCHLCASKKETAARKDGADVAAIVKRLRAYSDASYSQVKLSADEKTELYHKGRSDGLDVAIGLLESGRW